jgi:hypothetical protein
MQAISSDSQNILTLALIGIVLSGTWLAHNLGLFTFFNAINDEKKIVLPSFLFLLSPFLVPFLSSHPLPGALSSIIPVITFIVGQLFAESNNKKILSEKEREAIHQLHMKLLINEEKAQNNKFRLESRVSHPPVNALSPLEDIKPELIKLASFQGLIEANLRSASDALIIHTRKCATLIDKFNTELTQREANEREINEKQANEREAKEISTRPMAVDKHKPSYVTNRMMDRSLLQDTKDFLSCHNEFLDDVRGIKNF